MTIVVVFTTTARHDLIRYLASRTPQDADAVRYGEVYIEEMERQFREHEGPPPRSVAQVEDGGTTWWWQFTTDLSAVFAVEDRVKWLFNVERTITVLAFEVLPPRP